MYTQIKLHCIIQDYISHIELSLKKLENLIFHLLISPFLWLLQLTYSLSWQLLFKKLVAPSSVKQENSAYIFISYRNYFVLLIQKQGSGKKGGPWVVASGSQREGQGRIRQVNRESQ